MHSILFGHSFPLFIADCGMGIQRKNHLFRTFGIVRHWKYTDPWILTAIPGEMATGVLGRIGLGWFVRNLRKCTKRDSCINFWGYFWTSDQLPRASLARYTQCHGLCIEPHWTEVDKVDKHDLGGFLQWPDEAFNPRQHAPLLLSC